MNGQFQNNSGEYDHPPSIALDYDDTVSAHPALWRMFIAACKHFGSDIRIVTFRWAKGNNDDVEAFAKSTELDIIYCGGRQKKAVCIDEYGWSPDIWIDDMPMLIPTHDELSFMIKGIEANEGKTKSEITG